MANTYTNINDTKVVSSCLQALNIALNPMRVFTLDVGSDPAEKNDTINVPVVSARTMHTANTTNYENGNTSVVSVQVNMDTNLSASWHITAVQASKTKTNAFEASGVECIYGVMAGAYNTVLNKIVRASFGTSTEQAIASTAFDSDALLDGRNTCMNTLKWPRNTPMSLVLDGSYYANLMKDPAIKDKSASGLDAGVNAGPLIRFAGMGIYEDGMIASATPYASTEYLRGFYCLPSALAVGIRPPTKVDSGTFEVNEIITDPATGISANYRRWVNTQTNTLWGCVEILIGSVACRATGLYRIVSQASS